MLPRLGGGLVCDISFTRSYTSSSNRDLYAIRSLQIGAWTKSLWLRCLFCEKPQGVINRPFSGRTPVCRGAVVESLRFFCGVGKLWSKRGMQAVNKPTPRELLIAVNSNCVVIAHTKNQSVLNSELCRLALLVSPYSTHLLRKVGSTGEYSLSTPR